MLPDHTLPGDVPGLLRRGSPVVVVREVPWWTPDGEYLPDEPGRHTVVLGVVGEVAVTSLDAAPALDSLALDLTCHEGRIHALWWWDSLTGEQCIAARERAGVELEAWVRIATRVRFADDLTPDDLDTFARVMRAAVEVVRAH